MLDATYATDRGRLAAESRMSSRVTIRRRSSRTTQNETTGEESAVWDVVYTDLPFRSDGGGSQTVTLGEVTFEDATGVGHLPASTTNLADGDLIEVTSGEWAGDVFRIVAAIRYDQKTARRLPIVEEPRPTEW
jgi:hypothetical protein